MKILQNVMEELDTDEKITGMSALITLLKNSKPLVVKVLAVLQLCHTFCSKYAKRGL